MNELKQLRQEACSAIARLYKIDTPTVTQKELITRLARVLKRSVRTVRRWESDPDPDPLVEFAYRHLAGYIFGWPGWQTNLKWNEIRIWSNSVTYAGIPRQKIESLQYCEQLHLQQVHTLQQKIDGLENELAKLKASMPRPTLVTFLRESTKPTLVSQAPAPGEPGLTKVLKTANEK